jgi:8-oxo-dGTP diphosphatase
MGVPGPEPADPHAAFPPLPPPFARVGVGGVLLQDGTALVNKATYRQRFTIPGGFVDPGETLEAALQREFEEETGVEVRVGRLLIARHEVTDGAESGVYFAFAVEHRAGEPVPHPPEIEECRRVPVAEAVDAPWISPLSRLAIRVGVHGADGWPRSAWPLGPLPARALELYHPPLR